MIVTDSKRTESSSPPRPASLDAEQAVIACMLAGAELAEFKAAGLQAEHFGHLAFGACYTAGLSLDERGVAVESIGLAAELEQMAPPAGAGTMLDRLNGRAGLASLMQLPVVRSNARHYAQLVIAGAEQRKAGRRTGAGGMEVRWASRIQSKPIDWLWRGYLAKGKMTVIGGDPGLGKGMLTADLAARRSRGDRWPDGSPCPQGRTLILSGEDDPEDTINPRLEAARADRTRVGLVGYVNTPAGRQRPNLAEHAALIVQQARDEGADLLVVDPLSSYIGNPQSINAWRDQDVRSVLDPLAELIRAAGLAVILVVHLNKSNGGKAMYRFQSSIATIAAARFGYLLAPHPEDSTIRILAHVKSNLSKPPASLSFRIEETFLSSISDDQGRVQWLGSVAYTCDDLVGTPKETSAITRAEEFLLRYLAAGAAPSDEIKVAAAQQGVGKNALWEAKEALGVKARKVGLDRWDWALPSGRFKTAAEPSQPTGTLRDASDQNQPSLLTYVHSHDSSIGNGSTESGSVLNHPEGSHPPAHARAREGDGSLFDAAYLDQVGSQMDAEAAQLAEELA